MNEPLGPPPCLISDPVTPPRREQNRLQLRSKSIQDGATAMAILRPVLDFLLLAIILLPIQWYLNRNQCPNPVRMEMFWARAARGLWIAWLTHAAGLMDEALRVFLGIRLTLGLGTPVSVDKVYSKMSRWAEVAAKGIAVDDFPALATLYAGALDQGSTKRSSSGEVGAAAAETRANKSLVMKVEHVSATAYLWSFLPWSNVRRYRRVHVKGITLRLRQVNGILNFSFLAVRKAKGGRPSGAIDSDSASADAGGYAIEELDGIDSVEDDEQNWKKKREREVLDQENSPPVINLDTDGEHDLEGQREAEERGREGEDESDREMVRERGRRDEETEEVRIQNDDSELIRASFDTMSEGGAMRERGLRRGLRGRRFPSAWIPSENPSTKHWERQAHAKKGNVREPHGDVMAPVTAELNRRRSLSGSGSVPTSPEGQQPQLQLETPQGSGARGRTGRADSEAGEGGTAGKPAENLGNLRVVKVLGEAFMRRYNAYAEQVSATFNRVANLKLLPTLWKARGPGDNLESSSKKEPKRFEVSEILLEDVCICVGAGVWNDLLGDHVGAAFSPEFRLGVKVGPQELLTPDGSGRLARDIGMMLNEKLVRLLARLVMRETLKTSTLTSMVITSLALDTDARGRQQHKHKSLSPPPLGRGRSHGNLSRSSGAMRSTANGGHVPDPRSAEKRGKLWRSGSRFGANSSTMGVDLQGTGGGKGRGSFSPPLVPVERGLAGRGCEVETHPGLWRRRHLRKCGSGSINGDGGGNSGASVQDTVFSESGVTHRGARRRAMTGGANGAISLGSTHSIAGSESRGRQGFQHKKSMPNLGKPKRSWRRASEPGVLASLSPTPRNSRIWSSGEVKKVKDGENHRGTRDGTGTRATCMGSGVTGSVYDDSDRCDALGDVQPDPREEKELETVAKPPPWMEGVSASATYEEMKPALDVIKRTVLLAVFQHSNRTTSGDGSAYSSTPRQSRGHWSLSRESSDGSSDARRDEVRELNKELERKMQEEIQAWRDAGGDVDRLVMKALLAKVQDSGPNTAFKALASIEISSLIESLAAETRFSTYFENGGIDVEHVARSFAGRTVGQMMEGVRMTAGKVGQQAQRLRTEAQRWRKELLDDNGILPILSSDVGEGSASLASAVESLSGTFSVGSDVAAAGSATATATAGTGHGAKCSAKGAAGQGPREDRQAHRGSWEKGIAISADSSERQHGIEAGVGTGAYGDREKVDEVDVIMQVLQLLEAVESLKEGIVTGDSVALGKVEQAVGKVAQCIDVYLILAAGESMLGFLLERLGKLPVGHAKFAGKGFESRVWNLDLEGVRVARDKVDLVMKGFRLPKRGSAVMTRFGPGKIKRYKKRSRCFVVNLDWKMSNGKPVRAYLQPNDIVVLQGREGELSDEETEEEVLGDGSSKTNQYNHRNHKADAASGETSDGSGSSGATGGSRTDSHQPLREHNGTLRPEKGKRPRSSLYKIWGRRKAADAAEESAHVQDSRGGGGSENDSNTGRGGLWNRRGLGTVSAQPPAVTKVWQRQKSVDSLLEFGGAGTEAKGGTDSQALPDEEIQESPDSLPRLLPRTWTVDTAEVEYSQDGGSGGIGKDHVSRVSGRIMVSGPRSADFLAAPFLVARISGVGAKLKDVKWSVRQTHFPHLKTAGSLEATVSGLTIELELDTQDLPVASSANRHPRRRVPTDAAKQRAAKSKLGATPRGLRLSRLRVSVRTVKVHVSHSALSSLYNLAAVAFEAAVKRYVVESVEVAVRKSMFALLAMVNSQVSEKWDLLRSVGGGAAGAAAQQGGEAGASGTGGSAVDKVLAASLSHQVMWAPSPPKMSPSQSPTSISASAARDCADSTSNNGRKGNINGKDINVNGVGAKGAHAKGLDATVAETTVGKSRVVHLTVVDKATLETNGGDANDNPTYRTRAVSLPGDRTEYTPGRGSTDSESRDDGVDDAGGRGCGGDETASSCGTERITKRSLRKRLMGAVSRPAQPVGQQAALPRASAPGVSPAAGHPSQASGSRNTGTGRRRGRSERGHRATGAAASEEGGERREPGSPTKRNVSPQPRWGPRRRRTIDEHSRGLTLDEVAEGIDRGADFVRVRSSSLGMRTGCSRRAICDESFDGRAALD